MYALSDNGARALKLEEGLRLRAYRDVNGWLTIGYGHRLYGAVVLATITQAQAEELFRQDVYLILLELNKEVLNLTQNQVDALVSFIFNIGINAWRGSTARRDLCEGKLNEVPNEMRRWIHNNHGAVIPDLVARRNREATAFEGAKAA